MQITPEYMERFAVPIADEPRELQLIGWEMEPNASVSLDDPEGRSLAVNHWDEWPTRHQWDIREGTEKRWTFVIVTNEAGIAGDTGYEFPGLIKLEDLRTWYRRKLGLVDETPAGEGAQQ